MTEDRDRQIVERYYVGGCCWPLSDRGGALFWGVGLVGLGVIWLVANTIGLENWGEWVVPALFVAWGGAMLIGVASERRSPR
jgi:hypothetical protein